MNNIFNNTAVAFSSMSDNALKRAHFLFSLIGSPVLVKIGTLVTKIALRLHLPVEGLIRATVFDHFVGGRTEAECMPVVKRLYEKGVSSVLDYSVEGKENEAAFDHALKITLDTIDLAKQNPAIAFIVFKPTGFGRLALYTKVGQGVGLTENETIEWRRVAARFDQVCSACFKADIKVLIDAEETWMQDAADELVLQMMQQYNKQKAIVFNTLQLYRSDRLQYLHALHDLAKKDGFHIGMKLVRGAYMEKENDYAAAQGLPSPICESKNATDINFNAAVAYMVAHIDCMAIFAGTHNEESTCQLMDLMKAKQIAADDKRIWFGQLYGMSDNITYNLAALGYQVAKYLPFGPVRDVMPYLIRRAQENTSVAGQTGRELMLIKTELRRRKTEKKSSF